MAKKKSAKTVALEAQAASYKHAEATSPMRPEVGTQAQFQKKLPPQTYRYDSSLSPALDWDGQNAAREQGEALVRQILEAGSLEDAQAAAKKLKALGRPFLNWSGKAERLSFDVPTLPLFVHERLSTQVILQTLKGHKRDKFSQPSLFGDPEHSIADQVLGAYEFQDDWVNRLILGDSMVVMNSLLRYESLGGQVQMIYMDPPYGVKFGSNFQPFVRKRDVKHGDDEDLTREPEMVQAYRDTWELGLHSYLTYLRDRLLIARELLTPSGSLFVQISDENLHHVREVMDEVFGAENFCSVIAFTKTGSLASDGLSSVCDYLLFYAKDKSLQKFRQLLISKDELGIAESYSWIELEDGNRRGMSADEKRDASRIPSGARFYQPTSLVSSGATGGGGFEYKFGGASYRPPSNSHWKTTRDGLDRLVADNRVVATTNSLRYVRYLDDFPVAPISNVWTGLGLGSFTEEQSYVVQTAPRVIQRCLLMTTDPGDLVLDPSCGSGTTAYVAEQWGRRWITIDVSRVPLALARQRLLTATFPWYELADEERGPAGGFVYKRKQNNRGEEVGGIVPHVTLKSIANNEPPAEEVLVDRPETARSITRVTGPFCFEATIPTPSDWDGQGEPQPGSATAEQHGSFVNRMVEVLRRSPVLRLAGNRTITLKQVRTPAKSLSLSAEALVEGTENRRAGGRQPPDSSSDTPEVRGLTPSGSPGIEEPRPVAFVFGPENGAVSEKLVFEAAKEAHAKSYTHLYVIGFLIQPHARSLVENCEKVVGIPATYVQATPDLLMGDLLKNMRSSQIFSVCGLPDVELHKAKDGRVQVELKGLDVFDPITMDLDQRTGQDVPAWFLDTDYNDLCFHVCQAFFPRTSAWDNLQKALKGTYEESVWSHLSGTKSAPFEPGEHKQIAVKVIDDRGNELLVVKKLSEGRP